MRQLHGPITDRLLAEHGPTSRGWWPPRQATPTPASAAGAGYPLGGRRRPRRKYHGIDFWLTLLNWTFPSMSLWTVLYVTQGQALIYISHVAQVVAVAS